MAKRSQGRLEGPSELVTRRGWRQLSRHFSKVDFAHRAPTAPLEKVSCKILGLTSGETDFGAMSSALQALQARKDRLDEELKQVERQVRLQAATNI